MDRSAVGSVDGDPSARPAQYDRLGSTDMHRIASFLIVAISLAAACSAQGERPAIEVASDRIRDPANVPSTAPAETGDPNETSPASSTSVPPVPSTGSAGAITLDDPYVDDFGNGGYDVANYDLQLDWDPAAEHLDGITEITASSTQDLTAFNLELTGFEIGSVTVDGEPAAFERDGDEVTITPSVSIADGAQFTTVVEYEGTPVDTEFFAGDVGRPSGWHTRDGFAYVAGEPLSASTFHPANDHPSDKASFVYRITAPSDLTVAAGGTLEDKVVTADRTTWTFRQPDPQATYLTTLVIGDFTVIDDGTSRSGVPIRNVIATDLVDRFAPVFDAQPEMIDAFEALFGPYPFDVYGSAVVKDSFGGALETQTLSIYGADLIGFRDPQAVVAHELVHQWFGNNVSVQRWEDIWLNEGFASYGEALWNEASDPDFSYQDWIRELVRLGPALERRVLEPRNLFGPQVYLRGALTLHALRVRAGDEVFFDILQTWNERFGGGNATTADFEALSEELSGDDLDDFFDDWLRTEALPEELEGVDLGG